MLFNADQARAAHEDNDPVLLTAEDVERMLRSHSVDVTTIAIDDYDAFPRQDERGLTDAWLVLAWLGY